MKLISQLEQVQGKKPYQSYSLQHGIETMTVLVPLAEASSFEQQFNQLKDRSKTSITALVESLQGKVRG